MSIENSILLESGTNEMELLSVSLSGQAFGINVAKVQAIIQFDPEQVTRLPEVPSSMLGMLIYRDSSVPLIDLGQFLGVPPSENNDRPIVIITEFNNKVTGFKVDEVRQIHRLSWDEYAPTDQVFTNYDVNITGSVEIDGEDVLVLDLEKILTIFFPHLSFEEIRKAYKETHNTDRRRGLYIFFAEDSAPIRKHVIPALEKVGLTNLVTFTNGQQAFDRLQKIVSGKTDEPLPDLLITDIEMPKMDGLTLCRKIKKSTELADLRVIIFSSLINKQMVIKCDNVGADGYVAKPQLNKLIELIDGGKSPTA